MFHRFCAPGDAARPQGALTPEEFEGILRFVGLGNILSPAAWIERLERGTLEPHHLCITFDDGLRSQFEHALPVLDRLGLKAFWFVYSCVFRGRPLKSEIYSHAAAQFGGMEVLIAKFLERAPDVLLSQLQTPAFAEYAARTRAAAPFYTEQDLQYRFLRNRNQREHFEVGMDWVLAQHGIFVERYFERLWITDADLKTLADAGHAIGLHSWDHPYAIAELPSYEQRRQYQRNFQHIAEKTGHPPLSMSHPLGSYNDDSLTVLRGLGIVCGFRANMAAVGSLGINPSSLELAREDSATLLVLAQAG